MENTKKVTISSKTSSGIVCIQVVEIPVNTTKKAFNAWVKNLNSKGIFLGDKGE